MFSIIFYFFIFHKYSTPCTSCKKLVQFTTQAAVLTRKSATERILASKKQRKECPFLRTKLIIYSALKVKRGKLTKSWGVWGHSIPPKILINFS